MSDATPIDAALSGLDELAACDLRLAKRFCARIEALPEDEDDKAMDLARSYQRMARSYRQTLVVQARLRRELKATARLDASEAPRARRERIDELKDAIRADLEPRIWIEEREEERCEDLDALLGDLLDRAAARADFLDHPAATHVARMLEDLDLDAAPDAPPEEELSPRPPASCGEEPDAPVLFNGRLAPPMDLPSWDVDDDSS